MRSSNDPGRPGPAFGSFGQAASGSGRGTVSEAVERRLAELLQIVDDPAPAGVGGRVDADRELVERADDGEQHAGARDRRINPRHSGEFRRAAGDREDRCRCFGRCAAPGDSGYTARREQHRHE